MAKIIRRPNGWPTNKDRENWPSHIRARERIKNASYIDHVDYWPITDQPELSEEQKAINEKMLYPPLQQIILSPQLKEMKLVYGKPLIYTPKKLFSFINVGKRVTKWQRFKRWLSGLIKIIKHSKVKRTIRINDPMTVNELAVISGLSAVQIITTGMSFGSFYSINQKLTLQEIKNILNEHNIKAITLLDWLEI